MTSTALLKPRAIEVEAIGPNAAVVTMPLVFLSGVYFPLTQLPGWLRWAAEWLPVTAAVNLVRPLALGRWPLDPVGDLLLLAVWGAVCFALALGLTRRRMLK